MEAATYFAPPERETKQIINQQTSSLQKAALATTVLNALPDIAAILNEKRQFVYANSTLLKFLDINTQNPIIGLRLGEAINCINAHTNENGCGTSENCRYCGAVNAIIASNLHKEKVTKECRLTVQQNGINQSFDFSVTAAPFLYEDNFFTIITLEILVIPNENKY